MPNGRDLIITAPSGGDRSGVVIPTGWEQDVSIPNPIDRPNRANDRGIVGRGVDSFPMTGGMQFLGHVPLVHVAQGVTPRPANYIDDYVEIPAVFVGNPVTNP